MLWPGARPYCSPESEQARSGLQEYAIFVAYSPSSHASIVVARRPRGGDPANAWPPTRTSDSRIWSSSLLSLTWITILASLRRKQARFRQ